MSLFKKYLEKNSWVLNSHSDTRVVTLDTLGKWALQEWEDCVVEGDNDVSREAAYWLKLDKFKMLGMLTHDAFMIEIAFACLGEEKLKEHLKKVSDSGESDKQ